MITVTDIFAGAGGSSTGAASVPGGVRRYPGNPAYLVSPDGTVYGPRRFALKGHVLPDGYRRVTIAGRHVLRHLVVAETFIGPRPAGMQTNHIDGDKGNNRASNLEYVTPAENVRHSLDVLGVVRSPGEANGNARLTDDDVRDMRRRYLQGESRQDLALAFNIDATHVWRIVTNRSWRHVA